MPNELGEFLTNWTARLAVACYLARYAVVLTCRHNNATGKIARWCWTVGCGVYLAHVVAAFQFQHHWSQAATYEHTRERTLALTGFDTGIGLYVNYLFTLVWCCDVAISWRLQDPPPAWRWFAHSFMAFMVFNATVVFGPPFWKWIAFAVAVAFAFMGLSSRKRRKPL